MELLPGVPAGLLFLLLLSTPFSDNAKAAISEEDGAPEEEAVLSNMGGGIFVRLLRTICIVDELISTTSTTAVEGVIVGFSFIHGKKMRNDNGTTKEEIEIERGGK